MSDIHRQIMNIPCRAKPEYGFDDYGDRAYRLGHRDARHAAAELVVVQPPAVPDAGLVALVAQWRDEAADIRRHADFADANVAVEHADLAKQLDVCAEELEAALRTLSGKTKA